MKKFIKYLFGGILLAATFEILIYLLFPLVIYRLIKQRKLRKIETISTPNAVHSLDSVQIGNIKQWIEVRGEDINNPILLFLHGGPGCSMMPSAYSIHKAWEKNFTVVQWDQRGAGKTYATNKLASFINTMNITQMDLDLYEMVNYLRKRFNQEKIYLLGHSWGTVLGLKFAHSYPELLHAYIGVAQVINTLDNEKLAYQQVFAKAQALNNKKAIRALERIQPYPSLNPTLSQINTVRKWSSSLLNNNPRKSILGSYIKQIFLSPQYSLKDIFSYFRGILFSAKAFSKELMTIDFNKPGYEYQVPIIFMQSTNDPYVSSLLAQQYFDQITTPHKSLVLFEKSTHFPFSEECDKFTDCLKNISNEKCHP